MSASGNFTIGRGKTLDIDSPPSMQSDDSDIGNVPPEPPRQSLSSRRTRRIHPARRHRGRCKNRCQISRSYNANASSPPACYPPSSVQRGVERLRALPEVSIRPQSCCFAGHAADHAPGVLVEDLRDLARRKNSDSRDLTGGACSALASRESRPFAPSPL